MRTLNEYIKLPQKKLFKTIKNDFPSAVFRKDKYILVPGEAPILLVAHLDTVHHDNVTVICKSDDGNILMSPQGIGGDDRCGVYGIIKAYENTKVKPWLLFTCNEEIGGIGARQFVKDLPMRKELEKINFIVELDRKGKTDAVYYDCYCPELEKYIESKGFKTAYGTYSDICDIAPALGVSAVNLSSGYYNAHTQHEYINVKHLENTIEKVIEIVNESPTLSQFIYEESYASYDTYYTYGGFDEKKLKGNLLWYWNELLTIFSEKELIEYCEASGMGVITDLYWECFMDKRDPKVVNYNW